MSVKHLENISKEVVKAGSKTTRQVLIAPDEGSHFAMRRFVIEPAGEMPLHTNTVEHEQFVLNGRAQITIDNEFYDVKKNDVVYIPAKAKHSYKVIGNKAFEFLCVVPNKKDIVKLIK